MVSLKALIDKGAEMCGSQNALAKKLGVTSGQLSLARNGKAPIPAAKLQALAELIEYDAAELWDLQEIANLPRRNPFRHALSSALTLFLAVILSGHQNDAKAHEHGNLSVSQRPDTLYIVDCLRQILCTLAALVSFSRSPGRPMSQAHQGH